MEQGYQLVGCPDISQTYWVIISLAAIQVLLRCYKLLLVRGDCDLLFQGTFFTLRHKLTPLTRNYRQHIVFVDAYFIPFARHHRFISFMLYVLGFVGFVTNLKRNQLRRQFGLFCWIHMSLLLIVVSSHFIVNNILEVREFIRQISNVWLT